MPSLGYIADVKELAQTYQSLLLVEITLQPNSVNPITLYFASHALAAVADGGGGFAYNGHDYLPRLKNTDGLIRQLFSNTGIDFPTSVNMQFVDPDSEIWNWDLDVGIKGASLLIRYVQWEANTSNFTTDDIVKFRGICSQPSAQDESTINITGVHRFVQNANLSLPSLKIAETCNWTFPVTLADQQYAADSPDDSNSGECGYSPAATGGNAVGNYNATGALSAGITSVALTMTLTGVPTFAEAEGQNGNFYPAVAILSDGTNTEIINVLSFVSGSTYNISRAAQGSTAHAFAGGSTVKYPFGTCSKTFSACMNRLGKPGFISNAQPLGDITKDNANRPTGRFGGFRWRPSNSLISRDYITGKWEEVVHTSNEAKFGDSIPLAYGSTWGDCPVINVTGDNNYTKLEVLICYGQVDYIYDVVCNGVRIPHVNNDTLMTSVVGELVNNDLKQGAWQTVNDGRRNGSLNADTLYDKAGDCYGSMCVIELIVPKQLASASTVPQVRIRFDGPRIRVYTNPSTYTKIFSDNPAWVIADAQTWGGIRYSENDLASFISAAGIYDRQLSYLNNQGVSTNTIKSDRRGVGTVAYRNRAVSLYLRTRTTLGEVLRGLRYNTSSILTQDAETGLIQLYPKGTIAVQQSSLATLSGQTATNYTSTVPSVDWDAVSTPGYVAYKFDESNIANVGGPGSASTFKILPRTLQESPNVVSATFEDLENQLAPGSLTIIDAEDTARLTGQEITASFPAQGLNTFDRVRRAAYSWLSEQLRGNPRSSFRGETIGDTNGTISIEFETSMRAIHLNPGDICLVTYQQKGIVDQYFRLRSVQAGKDATRIKLQFDWHNDAWYVRFYGQIGAPLYTHRQGADLRPPFVWSPGLATPEPGNAIYLPSDKSFNLRPEYLQAQDNTAIAKVHLGGFRPVNAAATVPAPPLVDVQGTTATTGGTIVGGVTYYFRVAAKNVTGANFLPSFLSSRTCVIAVPAGTNTNTVTIDVPYWDGAAVGYALYGGTNVNELTLQKHADTAPTTITLTAFKTNDIGAPDEQQDRIRGYAKRVSLLGLALLAVDSCTSTTVTVKMLAGVQMTIDQFAGYRFSLMGMSENGAPSQAPLPIFDALVDSNNGDTFTLGAGLDGVVPDPTAFDRGNGSTFGLQDSDYIVIRINPTVGSDAGGNYIEDANFVNPFILVGSPLGITAATNANPGAITTAADHGFTTGDQVYITNMGGMTNFPAAFTITVTSTDTFTIGVDTTTWGTYTGGGTVQAFGSGLGTDAEEGNLLRVTANTAKGSVAVIASNTATRIYIEGAWPNGVAPDITSVVISELNIWEAEQDSPSANNADYQTEVDVAIDVSNYRGIGMVCQGVNVGSDDSESLAALSPVRDMLLFGDGGNSNFQGNISFQIEGNMAIGDDQCPPYAPNTDITLVAARLKLKQAPIGAAFTVDIYTGATLVMTLSIAAGSQVVVASAGQIAAAPILAAGDDITLNVTSVGSYPGNGLGLQLFY